MSGQQLAVGDASRRQFLKGSAITVAGALASQAVFAPTVHAAGNDTLKLGLIGCGGRGTGAAGQALTADKNVILTAVGDAFPDRLESCLNALKASKADQVKVDADHCFSGFDAYQKVIDSGVDVVILASPPGFRPQHLKAAVDAGKHVFCEKPVAVDGPGVRSVLETVKKAAEKKLALVSGFCWRYSTAEQAIFQRIHDGDIGQVTNFYGTYNTNALWQKPRKPDWSDMEFQMRNWLYFTWLSGDHLVEQCVHVVDKMAWTMQDRPPVSCMGHGGRQSRIDPAYGHIYDHFSVVYEYGNGVRGFIFCRQQEGCAVDVTDHIAGTKGMADIAGFRPSQIITGEKPWRYAGPTNNMYQEEHDRLLASIREGKPINNGERMAYSTLAAIMGRMAAYTGQNVTWQQAMESKENLLPAKLEFGPLAMPPVAIPGKTKFI